MTIRQEQSEIELLEAWCEGSEAAGDALLRRVFPSLYRFFINKVGDETEDLVQQTLMACTTHRKAILDSNAFRPWLFRIAKSRLYDHLRSLCRRRDRLDADFDRVSVVQAGTTHTSRVARDRAAQELRETLRGLPVHLQVVLELHYWEDQSTGEIAEALEIPQGTVKSRLRIAREALEAALATTGAEVLDRLGNARPDVVGVP